MYNWSVDEERFTTVEELVSFLTIQPEVLFVKKKGEAVIIVKLDPYIHPARKIHLTHYINDHLDPDTNISVREMKT